MPKVERESAAPLAESIYEKDAGGNSTLTRLDAELTFNKETEDWKPVTDSSLTYGDLRLLQEFVMGVEAERYHNTMVGPLPKRKREIPIKEILADGTMVNMTKKEAAKWRKSIKTTIRDASGGGR